MCLSTSERFSQLIDGQTDGRVLIQLSITSNGLGKSEIIFVKNAREGAEKMLCKCCPIRVGQQHGLSFDFRQFDHG